MGGLQNPGNWLLIPKDCTEYCRSKEHGDLITSAICNDKEEEAILYMSLLCGNFLNAVDSKGRTPLHVAASCGKSIVLNWLLQLKYLAIEAQDVESGYTALHRSIYYGQIEMARDLLQCDINVDAKDHDGLNYLDHVVKDRPLFVQYDKINPNEVYVWGSNINYNLGIGSHQPRPYPDLLSASSIPKHWKQVALGKYHSLFLSSSYEVFSCGHGQGGRLGLGTEQSQLSLQKVKLPQSCTFISLGRDHSILLLDSGNAVTFGLNQYGQLGQPLPCDKMLIPKIISSKTLMNQKLHGVAAGKFFSIFYNKDYLFTCGLNLGQLGHLPCEKSVMMPKRVSSLINEKSKIISACCSDTAVLVLTQTITGNINAILLYQYKCRKVASRPDIVKAQVLSLQEEKHGIKNNLRLVFLLQCGSILLWEELSQQLIRATMAIGHEVHITDFVLNAQFLTVLSSDGMLYSSNLPKAFKYSENTFAYYKKNINNNQVDNELTHKLPMTKLANIYRGSSVFSDPMGENYATLQNDPKTWLYELPTLKESTFLCDMKEFYQESDALGLYDCQVQCGSRLFYIHKFILAHRCPGFHLKYLSSTSNNPVKIETKYPILLDNLFQLLYSNSCDLLSVGEHISHLGPIETQPIVDVQKKKSKGKNKKKPSGLNENSTLKLMYDLACQLGLDAVAKLLRECSVTDDGSTLIYMPSVPYSFTYDNCDKLSDITLISEDLVEFKAHKCILVARSEYFKSMLTCGWSEVQSNKSCPLHLQIKSRVLSLVINFLYSDNVDSVLQITDVPLLCDLLVTSDQLLLVRLKSVCEVQLSQLLTIKNVADILELACIVNALELKQTCCQLITFNMAVILENRFLESCSSSTLTELSRYYQNVIHSDRKRTVNFAKLLGPLYIREISCLSNLKVVESLIEGLNLSLKGKGDDKPKAKARRNRSRKSISLSASETSGEDMTPVKSESISIVEDPPTKALFDKPISEEFPKPINRATFELHINSISNSTSKFTLLSQLNKEQEFPELGCLELNSNGVDSDEKKLPRKKFPKPKKQLKLLNEDTLQSNCPWNTSAHDDSNCNSLSDFITCEGKEMQTPNSGRRKITPESCKNPWTLPTNSAVTSHDTTYSEQHSFSAILEDEEKQYQNLATVSNKSLQLIQIEDQAINELLLYYENAAPDENVMVIRLSNGRIGVPLWKNQNTS